MNRVEVIEKEVRHMSREELAEFREWFIRFDSDSWDAQIESDAAAGKLDTLAQKALAEHQRGESGEL